MTTVETFKVEHDDDARAIVANCRIREARGRLRRLGFVTVWTARLVRDDGTDVAVLRGWAFDHDRAFHAAWRSTAAHWRDRCRCRLATADVGWSR